MRVLHVTSGNMYGGVETFLTTLARESDATPDMQSDFAVCFEGRFSAELARLGGVPHLLGAVRLSRPHTLIRARSALRQLLRQTRFDIVVCHQPWSFVAFGSAARRAGLPVVLWVHTASEGRHWLDRLARRGRPDLIICNSQFTAARLSTWLSALHVEPVYCPVSAPAQTDQDAQRTTVRGVLGARMDDVVIVQVSRLEAMKGQHVLLAALSELRDLPRWTCWMVGGAQRPAEVAYMRELQGLADAHGIASRVQFLGERNDVPAILRAADIFCQPNTAPEGFGLSMIEAMHAGLPVVTSAIGGACEIVDDSCGLLTPPDDVLGLSTALKSLIVDRDRRLRLGAAARRRPNELCDATRQMRRIHNVLSTVAAA
jgi:glycosyltransferase involved in cell wall biosynthesis